MLRTPRVLCALGVTLFVVSVALWSVLGHGVPSFRHDWRVPVSGDAVMPYLESLASGWRRDGIGAAQPYPTTYLVAALLAPIARFTGALGLVFATLLAACILIALGAYRLARSIGSPLATALALAAFATLNPWTYSKFVAGHIFMILAYGVWLSIAAEMALGRPNRWRLIALAFFIPLQIEFFALGIIPFAIWCVRRREFVALACATLAFLPIAFGLAAEYGTIRATPYLLAWQIGQSVDPGNVAFLRGYGFAYDAGYDGVQFALFALALLALAGIAFVRRRVQIVLVVAAVIILSATTGTKGSFSALYAWLVVHVPESGLFRELYDLVVVGMLIYIIGLARLAQRFRIANIAISVAIAIAIVPWLTQPIFLRTVPAAAFGLSQTPSDMRYRVAFDPVFQPVAFRALGSGVDPDAVVLVGHELPFNEPTAEYPVDTALARFERTGDTRTLGDLGVNAIVNRPDLRSNVAALHAQIAGVHAFNTRSSETLSASTALFTSSPRLPAPARIADDFGRPAILFADLPSAAIVRFAPQTETIDLGAAWIDARLTFATHPEFGNAFGGVATSSRLPLRVLGIPAILAAVRGELLDSHARILAKSGPYRWIPLDSGETSVICSGECAVAVGGAFQARLPDQGPVATLTPLKMSSGGSWTFEASNVPAGLLRAAMRYDRGWIAYGDGTGLLSHIKLNGMLNGWIVPRQTTRVHIVHLVSAVGFGLEILTSLALALTGILCLYTFRAKTQRGLGRDADAAR